MIHRIFVFGYRYPLEPDVYEDYQVFKACIKELGFKRTASPVGYAIVEEYSRLFNEADVVTVLIKYNDTVTVEAYEPLPSNDNAG